MTAKMRLTRDQDTPVVAKAFYTSLMEGGVTDGRRAAKPFRVAVEILECQVGEKVSVRWVLYV